MLPKREANPAFTVGTSIARPLPFLQTPLTREADLTFTVGDGAPTSRERSALPLAPQARNM